MIEASRLNVHQAEFAQAVLDPALPVPHGLVDPRGEVSQKRFAVYRNNVVAGLIDALRSAFPAVRSLVGEEFFSAMARVYVSRDPPRSPIMLDYGAGFANFVAGFEPAAGLPYLSDVTRLERAWLEAYHSAEARGMDLTILGGIAPDRLSEARLELHPSLRVVRSRFPIVTLWQMNIDGGEPEPLDVGRGGEDALIVRPFADVEVRTLSLGAGAFVGALACEASIAAAAAEASREEPRFDLANALAAFLQSGSVIGMRLNEDLRE